MNCFPEDDFMTITTTIPSGPILSKCGKNIMLFPLNKNIVPMKKYLRIPFSSTILRPEQVSAR